LDDWTVHHAFASIHKDVATAYARLFAAADSVTANSEGTLQLARSHGRDDAVLLPNGCDPEKFSTASRASGSLTLGYIGKIGRRLDLGLMEDVARALPTWRILVAGPVLEADGLGALRAMPNVEFLGDVHYRDIPDLLTRFDVGWVPHGVEDGQVGGDAIKIYEYRAAGLPVLTTPIIGTRERPMDGVAIREASEHVSWLSEVGLDRGRVERLPMKIEPELTWSHKTGQVASLMGFAP
jgi:glycosyltransferase involved in cell wall biosynthesis